MTAAVATATAAGGASIHDAGPGRFRVEGVMTMGTVTGLRSAGLQAFARAPGAIEVDLGAVRRADSGGLALLIDWLAWARQAGRGFSYAALPASLLALARLSDVEELLHTPGESAKAGTRPA
jgi:phospholipid transport system transporter-binding protein